MGHHIYFAVKHGSDALVPHADLEHDRVPVVDQPAITSGAQTADNGEQPPKHPVPLSAPPLRRRRRECPVEGRFTGLASGRVRDGEFAAPVRPAAAALKSCAKRDHAERDTPLTRGS